MGYATHSPLVSTMHRFVYVYYTADTYVGIDEITVFLSSLRYVLYRFDMDIADYDIINNS